MRLTSGMLHMFQAIRHSSPATQIWGLRGLARTMLSAYTTARGSFPVVTGRCMFRLLVFLLAAGLAVGQSAPPEVQTAPSVVQTAPSVVQTEPLTANDIMARVAANQNRSEALRKEYVYKQHIHIVTHKPQSRMVREETSDYDVVPQPIGIQKQLKLLTGRYWSKDKYVDFKGEQASGKTKGELVEYLRNHEPAPGSTDADLIHYLRNYLSNDKSKDGLGRALFPLSEGQKNYEFKLLGQEVEAGRNVYHIAFTPKDKDKEELTWTGEAFIDAAEFQPVRVFTRMSQRIPLLVRTMWFDLPGLGFNVVYKRLEDGVWFPSSFGTEFPMHVGPMFFINRDISISLKNSGFEHTPVETK